MSYDHDCFLQVQLTQHNAKPYQQPILQIQQQRSQKQKRRMVVILLLFYLFLMSPLSSNLPPHFKRTTVGVTQMFITEDG